MPKWNRNPLLYLFASTWHYSAGNRKNVLLYTVMFIIAESVDTIFSPLIWAKMMEVVTTQGINATSIKTLYICLALVITRTLVCWSLHGPARCIERNNAFKVRVNHYKYLLKGVVTLPLDWHIEHHTGDTIDKINKGTNALFDFSEVSFIPIRSFIQLVGSLGMLVYYCHSAVFGVVGMISISVWVTMRFDKILIGQYKELNTLENKISESVIDTISNISTIIILRVEKLVFEAIIHKVEKPYELFKHNQKLNELKWFFTSVCCNSMTVVVVLVYFLQNWGAAPGALTASFYILVNYLDRIGELFFRFTEMYGNIVKRKTRVMNSEELANDFIAENFANHVLPKDWGKLEIKNLNFTHKGVDESVLHLNNVSLSIFRGEKIVFVGETGSGKTTMLKAIRDLVHPKSLELSVDGRNVKEGFAGIARDIALVQQKPEIFATTIFENAKAFTESEMEFVRKFTGMARFTEVADSLPNGFDSSVKEDGLDLSGGQQQRLALSRGLLACHDKGIILLDEPTSSLDARTEIDVYKNIFEKFKDKTIISTTHGLHLLPLFDRICLFDKGCMVASGTLGELLTTCPEFVSLWEAMKLAKVEKTNV